MTETLRPLTLGEILDRTFQLYRRNFLLFVGIAAMPMLVLLLCGVGAGMAFVPLGIAVRSGSLQSNVTMIVLLVTLVPAILALVIAATVFTQAGITRAALGVCQGQKMKIREALGSVRPRFWRYFWLMILQGLFAVGIPAGAVALIMFAGDMAPTLNVLGPALTGVIVFFLFAGAGVAAIMLGMAIVMGMAISVAEDRPALASLKRAIQLSKGTRGRIFVMFLVVWALTIVLLMIAYIPGIIMVTIAGAQISRGGQPDAVTMNTVMCLYSLINFAIQTIVPPAYLIALALFYYDQRIRKEGFDIELLMRQAGLSAPLPPESGQSLSAEVHHLTGEQAQERE